MLDLIIFLVLFKKTFFHVCKNFSSYSFLILKFQSYWKERIHKKIVCLLFLAVRTISLSVWCHSPFSVSHNHTLFLSQLVVSFPIFFSLLLFILFANKFFFFFFCVSSSLHNFTVAFDKKKKNNNMTKIEKLKFFLAF